MSIPAFLITIDTEGDNLWSHPRTITTRNSQWLPRFQALCEKYGLVPTYLTNYEMACCPVYGEFAADALRRNAAEVGMHLHAWHSPPEAPITANDYAHNPYLIEYPLAVMREKITFLTRVLEDRFKRRMTSHRAGRWAFDGRYARILADLGYTTDCSVTPGVNWKASKGHPEGRGGTDYTNTPDEPYFLSSDDVCQQGNLPLLELPMTIMRTSPDIVERTRQRTCSDTLPRKVLNRLFPPLTWLRPNGANLKPMLRLLDRALTEGRAYVEFMLHSSEFMPGGSPTFQDQRSIEILYDHLEALFSATRGRFKGLALSAFATEVRVGQAPARNAAAGK